MREIKFRAWDKQKKTWANYQICDDMLLFMDKHTGAWKRDDDEKRFVLMQYTGLKDKNGVEIYEGDIVKAMSEGYSHIGYIKRRIDGLLIIYPAWANGEFWGLCPNDNSCSSVVVVGNIYENPELSKVEQKRRRKMSMKQWAKNEIEIAKKDSDKYMSMCLDSAEKAYITLMEDGHSGFSISVTKEILNRLIDGKPLSPIEDTDDNWNLVSEEKGEKTYQCKRMGSLFKHVDENGEVNLNDVDRVVCVGEDVSFYSSIVNRVIGQLLPIKMPYYPMERIHCYIREFQSTNEDETDFPDTLGLLYYIDKDGEKVEVGKYFKDTKEGFIEIDYQEYMRRKGEK